MKFRDLVVLAIILFACEIARARTPAPINVPALIAASDLIVVGRLSHGTLATSAKTQTILHAERLIKGQLAGGGKDLDIGESGMPQSVRAEYGIFFLRMIAQHYEPTNPDVVSLPASPLAFQQAAPPIQAEAQVAAELASVFGLSEIALANKDNGLELGISRVSVSYGRDRDGHEVVRSEVPSALRLAEDVYFRASNALRSIPYQIRRPYLVEIINSSGPQYGRLWAYASTLEAGDTSRLEVFSQYLLRPSEQARVTNLALMLAFERPSLPNDTIPFLVKLLGSSNEKIREGVVYQLNKLQALVPAKSLQLALHDEDPTVRGGVVSLACLILPKCPAGDTDDMAQPKNVLFVEEELRQLQPH